MKDNSYKTAISRTGPSAPLKHLMKKGMIQNGKLVSLLDYGCGKGADANFLQEKEYFALSYDPRYAPNNLVLKFKYDVILCTYVLNVVEEAEEKRIINKLKKRLKPNGRLFISVRRDLKEPLKIKNGRIQRMSYPDLKSLYKNKNFEIYQYQA